VLKVKKAIEERIGRRVSVPRRDRPAERQLVEETFAEWIADVGAERVVASCEAIAREKAREGGHTTSMLYFAHARDRAEEYLPGDRPDLDGITPVWRDEILRHLSVEQTAQFWFEHNQLQMRLTAEGKDLAKAPALGELRKKWKGVARGRAA
jgi:hypothetical protein